MCDRFIKNRAAFARFMYSLDSFGEKEIVEMFKEKNGDIAIDGTQTISQYLRRLRENGALQYSRGKYTVPKVASTM